MVMLGALLELVEGLSQETAQAVLDATVQNSTLLEIDRRALEVGRTFIRESVPAPAQD
jgi:Pyruvate/2-oxoacid:ferredoxin oxidoreductase gamma subunit